MAVPRSSAAGLELAVGEYGTWVRLPGTRLSICADATPATTCVRTPPAPHERDGASGGTHRSRELLQRRRFVQRVGCGCSDGGFGVAEHNNNVVGAYVVLKHGTK